VASDSRPEWLTDSRVIRVIRHDPASVVDTSRWPATVPVVEQLLCEGLSCRRSLRWPVVAAVAVNRR
jgi:hypothetical protein